MSIVSVDSRRVSFPPTDPEACKSLSSSFAVSINRARQFSHVSCFGHDFLRGARSGSNCRESSSVAARSGEKEKNTEETRRKGETTE